MPSTSPRSPQKRIPVPAVPFSTGPIVIPAVDLGPRLAGDVFHQLLPDHVAEPEYIARGNKVKCCWCGAKYKTRAKYVSHFKKRHM